MKRVKVSRLIRSSGLRVSTVSVPDPKITLAQITHIVHVLEAIHTGGGPEMRIHSLTSFPGSLAPEHDL